MKKFPTIFVTVGTTRFDELTRTVCSSDILTTFQKLGCTRLIVQYGRGDSPMPVDVGGIAVEAYSLKPSIAEDIKKADLVISHAGAGSCLEILRQQKPLVVVINEELMGNHQIELAEQLYHDGNLFYCTPRNLDTILATSDFDSLRIYEKGNMSELMNQLDILMGFK